MRACFALVLPSRWLLDMTVLFLATACCDRPEPRVIKRVTRREAAGAAMPHVRTERRDGGFAIVWLQREPVNTMDLAFWKELAAALAAAEADPSVRGLIFASALKRDVFTAGNDIKELYAPGTSFERSPATLFRRHSAFVLCAIWI